MSESQISSPPESRLYREVFRWEEGLGWEVLLSLPGGDAATVGAMHIASFGGRVFGAHRSEPGVFELVGGA